MTTTILIVGDVHRYWRAADKLFCERGDQDLLVFVGDLGDEDTGIVQSIADVEARKVVMLGNHDAWRSFRHKSPTSALMKSLEILGDEHLAYSVLNLPEEKLSLVGGRPFSWGGPDLRSPELYRGLYGVGSHEESAARIAELAAGAAFDDILLLAHNGPTGLSEESHDIWGKDFGKSKTPRGDWGDRDLELAIRKIRRNGGRVAGLIAGHMHHKLFYPRGGERTRFLRQGDTVYMNAAVVPRVFSDDKGREVGHFLRVVCESGRVVGLEELHVDGDAKVVDVRTPRIL